MAGTALDSADVEALASYLELLAEATAVQDLRRRAVEALPAVVPSTVTAWNEVDPATGSMENPVIDPAPTVFPGGDLAAGRAIFAAHVHEHPVIQHFIRTGDGRPAAISDFLTAEEFHETELYQRFYRVLGVEEQIALQLPSPSPVVAITLHGEWEGFSDRDRLLLNLIRPQLVQALRNAEAIERLARIRDALEKRVEETGEGLVLLGPDDVVEYASPQTEEILPRWFGAWRWPALPRTLTEWVSDLERQRPVTPPWPLVLRRHGRQLTVRRLTDAPGSSVALLVTEIELDQGAAPMLAHFGLTPRQAEVMDLAVQGASNRTIASKLGISSRTVETHMTGAMAKLGVESRTAAANLLHQAVADGRGPLSA